MFSSRRAKNSAGDICPSGSLFDFLKRKKLGSMHSSITQNKQETNELSFSNIELKQDEDGETYQPKTSRRNGSTVTPKKVTFALAEENRQTARTFIDMISPIKQQEKSTLNLEISSNKKSVLKENKKSVLKESKHKNNSSQQFNRRELNKSVDVLIETIHKLIRSGKNLKQKSHSLFIDMKPVLKLGQQVENKIIRRKCEDAKQKLRTMNTLFQQLNIQNENQIIESFHRSLSEHLISVQAKIRNEYDRKETMTVNQIQNTKYESIKELKVENNCLISTNSMLDKKVQKLQRNLQQLKQQSEQKIQNYQICSEQRVYDLHLKLTNAEEEKIKLKQKIIQLQKQLHQKDKKVKDVTYSAEFTERQLLEQAQKSKSTREEFLLAEMTILKKEFQKDMSELSALYLTKSEDQARVIQQQQFKIQELQNLHRVTISHDSRVASDLQALRSIANKHKKQNQCLVTDLHRINQQLYQHWLALKDIKVLATRLQLLPKFSKIYEDLAFNDLLFS